MKSSSEGAHPCETDPPIAEWGIEVPRGLVYLIDVVPSRKIGDLIKLIFKSGLFICYLVIENMDNKHGAK